MGADQYRNRIVVFERDNWLKKLEEAVAENDRADFVEELRWATFDHDNVPRCCPQRPPQT
jgi:hypothetical protein